MEELNKLCNVLKKYAVPEIRSRLCDIEWGDREYKAEQLNSFLKGLNYALRDRGFEFVLRLRESHYSTIPRVEVYKYIDPVDFWSGRKHLFDIFPDHIEVIEES